MSNRYAVETIDLENNIRVLIVPDEDPQSPADWDSLGQIAYLSRSRYVLGTESVSSDRLDEIGAKVRSGEYIGIPVFAYVHGQATIKAAESNPFHCQWDSGRSGWVYCTREDAIREFGKKVLTKKVREAAEKCLRAEVETFAQYLRGEVYGFVVERVTKDEDGDITNTEELDSCWGFYGLECAIEEGKAAGKHEVEAAAKESAEVAFWAQRDVPTFGVSA